MRKKWIISRRSNPSALETPGLKAGYPSRRTMADLFTVLKDHSGDLIPLKNGIIERYEIQDIHTCDVHVMYRVPFVRYP